MLPPRWHQVSSEEEPLAASPSVKREANDSRFPDSSPAFPLAATAKDNKPKLPKVPKLTDEQLAQKLAAEWAQDGARETRGGGTIKKKSTWGAKKKSKAMVDSDDDDSVPKKRKVSNTGFNKLHLLSEPVRCFGSTMLYGMCLTSCVGLIQLAAVCGTHQLSRPGVTKALWVRCDARSTPRIAADLTVPSLSRSTSRRTSANILDIRFLFDPLTFVAHRSLQDPYKKTDILPDAKLRVRCRKTARRNSSLNLALVFHSKF